MKTKVKIDQARQLARGILAALSDVCDRVEIAGSIRRNTRFVGDIEIVAIPKFKADLFGSDGESLLDLRLQAFLDECRFTKRTKNGPKYKQFMIRGCRTQLDLFITTPECWPVVFAIRTGPAEYSRQFVTPRNKGGLLQNGCNVSQGRLYQEGNPVDLRDEKHLFDFVQGGWVDPLNRSEA